MKDKRTRILETAIELAEQGGFEAVRLRDVAAHAEVALGTLYKRFSSKEVLLIAALDLESEKLEKKLALKAAPGETQVDRILAFFEIANKSLFRKPNLARAILRALTSGEQDLTAQVATFHTRTTNLIVAAMRGDGVLSPGSEPARPEEQMIAFVIQQVWFASLVGWMGGLFSKNMISEQLRIALVLLLQGLNTEKLA